jgi:hypothetical protein
MADERFINNKTGRIYLFVGYTMEATNGQEGKMKVLYRGAYPEPSYPLYVRDADEFFAEFTLYIPPASGSNASGTTNY